MEVGGGSSFDWGRPVAERKRPSSGEKMSRCSARWKKENLVAVRGWKSVIELRRRGSGTAAARLNLGERLALELKRQRDFR
jgi:hypothetical protein